MVQPILIKRTLTANKAPTSLQVGELAIELASTPPRMWVGVTTVIDPSGMKMLLPSSSRVTVAETPIVAPVQGDLWYESDSGVLWMWFNDGNSQQWVQVNGVPTVDEGGAPIGIEEAPIDGKSYMRKDAGWIAPTAANSGFMAFPAGIGFDWFGPDLPNGTRWCDGALYEQALLPALFAAIGNTYGGAGTTFAVPDVKGRATIGRDDMGGTAALRMTTAGGGINGTVLGAVGGNEKHTLSTPQIPSHFHNFSPSGQFGVQGATITQSGLFYNANTGNAGGSGAHPNVQPGFVCNKIISTGGVA